MAAELIGLNVEVVLAAATPAAMAARNATSRVAIVMADPGDAVELGLVSSLARPWGKHHRRHITCSGISDQAIRIAQGGIPEDRASCHPMERRYPAGGSGVEGAQNSRTDVRVGVAANGSEGGFRTRQCLRYPQARSFRRAFRISRSPHVWKQKFHRGLLQQELD